jgi:hypothetical protein
MVQLQLLLLVLLVSVGSTARSQSVGSVPSGSTPKATAQNAADAQAVTKPLTYRSPFTAYQADKIEETRSWREVNDRVGSIGGWRVYAREAQAPQSTPPAIDKAAPAPRN